MRMLSKTSFAFKVLKHFFNTLDNIVGDMGGLYLDRSYALYPDLRELYLHRKKNPEQYKRKVQNAVYYLKKKKYIKKKQDKFIFTKEALVLLFSDKLEQKALKNKTKKWDGIWRVLLYDIPEEERVKREILRGVIKRLGFKKCQKSVWVCKYSITKELVEISRIFDLEKYIVLFETDKVSLGEQLFNK